MSRIRRTVVFSGAVQGVFFRATTRDTARRFAVTGYVRNLPDGRVELVAEGESVEIDSFVAAVEEAMVGFIDSTESSEFDTRGEFKGFAIRY
ncbi:MAG: acylphosphatase [Phycisphaerae bacterium]